MKSAAVKLVLFFIFASLTGVAFAQFSSVVTGSVKDNTGAVIPGAKLVLTNEATGVSNSSESNSDGLFRFPSLGEGNYMLIVSLQGFSTFTERHIVVTSLAIRDVPVQLRAGEVTTSIDVTAASTAVDTDEARIGSVTTEREINELPIQGGNIFTVTAQTPGVVGTGFMGQPSANIDIFYATTTPAVASNGAPNSGNVYLLDGISLDDSPSGGDSKLVPNKESISEVVVSTNNYSAEFGKGSSLVTQITSKAGTNRFHGSLFEYHQDNDLTARTHFQNTPDPISHRFIAPFRRNEFGGSIGGPIHKDSSFFFFSFDQVRSTTAGAFSSTTETPDFTNFLKTAHPNAFSTQLLTKYPSAVVGLNNFQTVAEVEAAQVPASQQLCSAPGATVGPDGLPCSLPILASGIYSFDTVHNGYQYNGRFDQSFANNRDRVYANFYHNKLDTSGGIVVRPTFNIVIPQTSTFAAINYTHVFSTNILNQASAGYTRTTAFIPCNVCELLPIGVNNLPGFGDGFAPTAFAQNDFDWKDMLSVIHGKHAMKFGAEMQHNQDFSDFTVNDSRNQSYNFETIFDFAEDTPSQENGILYDPRTGGIENGGRYYVSSTYGFYGQDDWKVKSNLTINAGLRWDFTSNPSELKGTLSTIKLGPGSSLQEQIAGASVSPAAHPYSDHPIGYFAPRFGFAYQPSKDWSVRGAFGIFFNRGGSDVFTDTESQNPPFAASVNADIHVPNGPQPVYGLCASGTFPFNCPRPANLPVNQFNARGGLSNVLSNIGGPATNLKQSYVENFFVGVQRAFARNWIAEADFTHSTGVRLYSIFNRNRYDGQRDPVTLNLGPFLNPYFGGISYADTSNHSSYNGGTFFVRKNFDKGYSFQVAYTVSKAIDLISAAPGADKGSENAVVIDAYNIGAQRGLSSGDIPKQLSFNFDYHAPSPHTGSRFLDSAGGGWELTSLATLAAGTPVTVFTGTPNHDFNLDGNGYDLPNVPSFGRSKKGVARSQYLTGVFKVADFPLPLDANGNATGQEGNLGRNTYRGPGFAQVDSTLAKNTHIPWFVHDGADLRLSCDFYNLFNRVNLTGFDTNLDDLGNFGKATSSNQGRTLQLSGRIVF